MDGTWWVVATGCGMWRMGLPYFRLSECLYGKANFRSTGTCTHMPSNTVRGEASGLTLTRSQQLSVD